MRFPALLLFRRHILQDRLQQLLRVLVETSYVLPLSLLKRLYVTTVQVFVTHSRFIRHPDHVSPDRSLPPSEGLERCHCFPRLPPEGSFFESSRRRGVWGHVPFAPPILSSSCCVHLPIPSGGRTRTTAVKQKAHEMKADRIQGHLEKKRRMTYLTDESKNSAATAVKVPT